MRNIQIREIENSNMSLKTAKSNELRLIRPRLSPPGVNLTRRESECFYLLSKIPTVKKLAKTLQLSPRTIEMYINQIKSKMGVSFKSEVIEIAIALSFHNQLDTKNNEKERRRV